LQERKYTVTTIIVSKMDDTRVCLLVFVLLTVCWCLVVNVVYFTSGGVRFVEELEPRDSRTSTYVLISSNDSELQTVNIDEKSNRSLSGKDIVIVLKWHIIIRERNRHYTRV